MSHFVIIFNIVAIAIGAGNIVLFLFINNRQKLKILNHYIIFLALMLFYIGLAFYSTYTSLFWGRHLFLNLISLTLVYLWFIIFLNFVPFYTLEFIGLPFKRSKKIILFYISVSIAIFALTAVLTSKNLKEIVTRLDDIANMVLYLVFICLYLFVTALFWIYKNKAQNIIIIKIIELFFILI